MARCQSHLAKTRSATGAGTTAGDIVHTFLAVVGISAIIATSAVLFSIIKYLGAAYLVYLGIKAIIEKSPTSLGGKGQVPSLHHKPLGRQFSPRY
jgi:threonine/homoserine/homoserine lactone efflux protein